MENEDKFIDDEVKIRPTVEEAKEEIIKVITGHEIANIKSLPKAQRDEIVARVKKIDGLTQRQIARIFGISLSLINKA